MVLEHAHKLVVAHVGVDADELVRLSRRDAQVRLGRAAEERLDALVDLQLLLFRGVLEFSLLKAEEAVVLVGVEDVQEVVEVLVGVGQRRSRKRKGVARLRAYGERRLRLLATHALDTVDLVKDEECLICGNALQVIGYARRRLVVDENKVDTAYARADEALLVWPAHAHEAGILRRKAREGPVLPKAQAPLRAPGVKRVLGAHYHQPLDQPSLCEKGEGAEHRGGLARAGDGEVARTGHGGQEEGIAHLAVLEPANHDGVHHARELGQLGVVLTVSPFNLVSHAVALVRELLEREEARPQRRRYLKGAAEFLGQRPKAVDYHLKAGVVVRHGEDEKPVPLPLDVTPAPKLVLGAAQDGVKAGGLRVKEKLSSLLVEPHYSPALSRASVTRPISAWSSSR